MRGKFFREGAELQLPVSPDRSSQAEFAQGQIVCLASAPCIRGAVVEVLPGTAEDRFRPVLKFIRSDRPRLLIADGVGKTIEAGLILRELPARREIQSVLIICPRPLVTEDKWEKEMRRFDQRFTDLDGRTLRYCISEMDLEGAWPERHQKTIMPYSLFDEALLYGPEGSRKRRRGKGLCFTAFGRIWFSRQ